MEIQKKTKHMCSSSEEEALSSSIHEDDAMIEIFLWLPVKSLIRFRSLSKRWNFLISHKNSFFRNDYLTNITTRGRKRIVGSYDHSPPSMAGFFSQVSCMGPFYDRVRFVPTSTEFVKKEVEIITNPFSFLDYKESLDKFLLFNCLDYDPAPVIEEIYILASSNGFLLCSLGSIYAINYCLVNPITKEWTTLPEPKIIQEYVEVGFVCKGDYPSLASVEYMIVRVTWSMLPFVCTTTNLSLEIFSSGGDDQWRQFTCSSDQPLRPFRLFYKYNPVIVKTSDQGIIVYCLAMVRAANYSVIVVFDLNKGLDLLEMIETPGKPEEKSGIGNVDFIAGFDGVIHYVRYNNTYIELWVLDSSMDSTREWFLKHRLSLTKMMEGCHLWMDVRLRKRQIFPHIQGLHPMNPNLVFLTLEQKMVWCNFESGKLELVCDQRSRYPTYFYAYQWPCWPPLL